MTCNRPPAFSSHPQAITLATVKVEPQIIAAPTQRSLQQKGKQTRVDEEVMLNALAATEAKIASRGLSPVAKVCEDYVASPC